MVDTTIRIDTNERTAGNEIELILSDLKVVVVAIGEVFVDFGVSSDQVVVVGEVLGFEIVDFTYDVFRSGHSGVVKVVHCIKMVAEDMLVRSMFSHRDAWGGKVRKKRKIDGEASF